MQTIDKLWEDNRQMRCLTLTDGTSWRTSPFRDDLARWQKGDQVAVQKEDEVYFLFNQRLDVKIEASKVEK